jgi:hypothetical protein
VILEATVIMSSWFKDPVCGINKLLADVPRNKMGSGTIAKPTPVTIYDDIQDNSVAMELEPVKVPAVVVFCDSDISAEMDWGMLTPLKGTGIIMAASYIYRDMDPLLARQQGMFVLRAIQRSLNRFNSDKFSHGRRRLNDISISQVIRTRQQRVTGAVGNSTLAGFVLAHLDVTDHAP